MPTLHDILAALETQVISRGRLSDKELHAIVHSMEVAQRLAGPQVDHTTYQVEPWYRHKDREAVETRRGCNAESRPGT